jgi:Leucine-rich repeat (LRR) protein
LDGGWDGGWDGGGVDAAGGRGGRPAVDGGADRSGAGGVCGTLIDDIEDGTGHICEGPEGRVGVWYAFNSDAGTQWPQPTTPGIPIPTSEIPGGRGASRRAMHTYGTAFGGWGAGVGFDVAFDGTTYRVYDASAYAGVKFWARGTPQTSFNFRISTAVTTLPKYGGVCPSIDCPPDSSAVLLDDAWQLYWVPFMELNALERNRVTNMQFLGAVGVPFDFWIDDVSFFVGPPDCCPAGCAGPVSIPDANLSSLVHQVAGADQAAPLACSDVCAVPSLLVPAFYGVQSLDGLECLASMAQLTLSQNQIADLTPLAPLGRLMILDLSHNQIADVTPLADLTRLRALDLTHNQIADVAPLAGLAQLISLGLGDNRVRDVGPLTALGQLTTLDLSQNLVTDVQVAGGLDRLASLALAANQIAAVRAPFVLPGLTNLGLAGNLVTDVSGLAGAPRLQVLDLGANQMRDLRSLPALPQLDQLLLAQNQLVDLTGIQGAPGLTYVDLSSNQVADVGPLGALTGLTNLSLGDNRIADVGPLAGLVNLSALGLGANQVADLGALAGMTRLQMLDISQNQIGDLTPLTGAAALLRLDAHDNRIERLDGLGGKTFLALDLSNNQIVVPALPAGIAFAAIDYGRGSTPGSLDLSSNAIRDLAPLVASPALGNQMVLDLQDNPIDCAAQAANLQALRARVALLYTDCP